MTTATPILSPERWEEYFARLEGPEGCDFKEETPGDVSTMTWRCAGGFDKSYSRTILAEMGLAKSSIAEVLAYVESFGGHCDCEVLLNAAERILPDDPGDDPNSDRPPGTSGSWGEA